MEKLIEFRTQRGWSQNELARRAKVSQTYISELEAKKKDPTIKILKKLAKALNVSIVELIVD